MPRTKRLKTNPLNSVPLLFGHGYGLGGGRQRHVIVCRFTKKLEKLIRIRGDELRQTGVPGAQLLENGLKHLRLLLNDLAELLELRIVPKKVQIAKITTLTCGSGGGSGGGSSIRSCVGTAAAGPAASLLSCEIEEVDASFILGALSSRIRLRGSNGGGGG